MVLDIDYRIDEISPENKVLLLAISEVFYREDYMGPIVEKYGFVFTPKNERSHFAVVSLPVNGEDGGDVNFYYIMQGGKEQNKERFLRIKESLVGKLK